MQLCYPKYIIVLALSGLFVAGCATTPHFVLKPSLQGDIRRLGGAEYVPLGKLCGAYGVTLAWDDVTRTATIQKGDGRIVMRAGSKIILVNGSKKKLDKTVVMESGAAFVPVSFVRGNLGAIVGETPAKREPAPERAVKYTIKTVVLDPGHGGHDPGAIGGRLRSKEKEMTLAAARRLKGMLEENGIRVIMTRSSDTFISLGRRARTANSSGADLFVSLHINASRSRSLKGFECYFLSNATDDNARALEASENARLKLGEEAQVERSRWLDRTLWDMKLSEDRQESAMLADYICSAVRDRIDIGNRGMRTARFYVLKYTRMPAVLVEAGYISNKFEEAKLRNPAFLNEVALAVGHGILRFKEEYERTEAFTRQYYASGY